MFHLHYDTDLTTLADRLADLLARRGAADVLVPRTVLVPQAGLQRWLVQHLAERHGIAANLEFLMPAQWVWRLLRAWHPDLPKLSRFEREVMRWSLFERLGHEGVESLLPGDARESTDALRRFELAGHLARLFERYQGYRRDLLDGWEQGQETDDVQACLWRHLAAVDEPSRARLLGDFLACFTAVDAPAPPGLPARLFAFGTINVSPDVLRVLGLAGRHVDVQFFLPTPCADYWGDARNKREEQVALLEQSGGYFNEPDNPLLTSMGMVGRDFVAQVFRYDEVVPDAEFMPEDVAPPTATLLQRVQADVIKRVAPQAVADVPIPDDRSLVMHACHSPLREVQVLHDQLLAMLADDETLQPRDIAVMVTDVGRYAPCVDAVFGAMPTDDKRRIPWTVADRPLAETHALVALFLGLLDLPGSRLAAREVLDVLAVPAVQRRFDLSGVDQAQLAAWVEQAGIRWGADAEDRAAQGLPAFEEFSWRFGQRRLLLGYMSGAVAEDILVQGIAPLTDVEGGAASALGALFAVVRVLRNLRRAMRVPRAAVDWLVLLHEALDALLAEPEGRDEERAMDAVRGALKVLAGQTAAAGMHGEIDWITLRAFVREALTEQSSPQRFLSGGVSVCGLVPLRNVPFKVICVLGLDAESFPRRDPADALDRIYADRIGTGRRPGDRSLREDDRYLFLQTLMAARDTLYLSWTGMDARTGKEREPSVLLSELLDLVCKGYSTDAERTRKHVLTRHPMQPFSRRLFVADKEQPAVFTYRHEWLPAAQAGKVQPLPPFVTGAWPAEPVDSVSLDELRRFFRNPAKAFLRQQAQLSLPDDTETDDEREPLVLNRLQQHGLVQGLVDVAVRTEAPLQDAEAGLRARGLLPPLTWGEAAFAEAVRDAGPALQQWRVWRQAHAPLPDRPFRLPLNNGHVLEGVLDGLHEGGYAGWVGKAGSGKNLLSWWIGALVAVALERADEYVVFGRDDDKVTWRMPCNAHMPTAKKARELLTDLLDAHAAGRVQPLPLPPYTAFAFAAKAVSGKFDGAIKAARDKWQGSWSGKGKGFAEKDDAWFALALRGRVLFDEGSMQGRFQTCAEQVYLPMCQALAREVAA